MRSLLLTHVLEHSVALVEDKHLEVIHVKRLVFDEGQDSSWGSHDNVWLSITLEELHVLLDWLPTVNDFGADIFHELRETDEFSFDLVGKLSVVAEDDS